MFLFWSDQVARSCQRFLNDKTKFLLLAPIKREGRYRLSENFDFLCISNIATRKTSLFHTIESCDEKTYFLYE